MRQKQSLQQGTALLISILMMGFLITVTLGISALTIREISVTQSIVNAGRAYYAAEAGVERALYLLANNGPGFEPDESDRQTDLIFFDSDFEYSFEIKNSSTILPNFSDDEPIFISNTESGCVVSNVADSFAIAVSKNDLYNDYSDCTFRKLSLNETHVIPLFVGNDDVNGFLLQYYTISQDLFGEFSDLDMANVDVLRWKLYGSPTDNPSRTESIADFYPAVFMSGSTKPICIGTDPGLRSPANENCFLPMMTLKDDEGLSTTLFSAARECYLSDAGAYVTNGTPIKGTTNEGGFSGACQMSDFLASHKKNYLLLTNLFNPILLGISDPTRNDTTRADIYYRILVSEKDKLPKDYALIISTGKSSEFGNEKKLSVNYRAKSYLPVFNFSLYGTKN